MKLHFGKIDEGIFESTVFTGTTAVTKLVWMCIIIKSDQNGEFRGSIPGMAKVFEVDPNELRAAFDFFMSPDPDSQTPDNDGTRMVKIEGGWRILNKRKYSLMGCTDENKIARSEQNARAYAKKTLKNAEKALNNTETLDSAFSDSSAAVSSHVDRDVDRDVDSKNIVLTDSAQNSGEFTGDESKGDDFSLNHDLRDPSEKKKKKTIYSDEFETFWKAYPRRIGKKKAFTAFKNSAIPADIIEILETHKKQESWKRDSGSYIPHPATWLHAERWLDEIHSEKDHANKPDPDSKWSF